MSRLALGKIRLITNFFDTNKLRTTSNYCVAQSGLTYSQLASSVRHAQREGERGRDVSLAPRRQRRRSSKRADESRPADQLCHRLSQVLREREREGKWIEGERRELHHKNI